MAKIITVSNQKGGVGKTTTATTMADILHKVGRRVLLIDLDAQRNSTTLAGAKSGLGVKTIYDVLMSNIPIKDVIQETQHYDVAPGDKGLNEISAKLQKVGREFILADHIDTIRGDYDFIIIDTPPALGLPLNSAMIAADELIIPLTSDAFAVSGLNDLVENIQGVKRINRDLKIAGLLLVSYEGRLVTTKDWESVLPDVAKNLGTKVFDTKIRATEAIRQSHNARMHLLDYDPGCNAAKDYVNFVKEYLGGK